MTYEESYMKCGTRDALMNEVKNDLAIATMINPDRIEAIKNAANKVLNLKFNRRPIKDVCRYKSCDGYCELHSDGLDFREPCIQGECDDFLV